MKAIKNDKLYKDLSRLLKETDNYYFIHWLLNKCNKHSLHNIQKMVSDNNLSKVDKIRYFLYCCDENNADENRFGFVNLVLLYLSQNPYKSIKNCIKITNRLYNNGGNIKHKENL